MVPVFCSPVNGCNSVSCATVLWTMLLLGLGVSCLHQSNQSAQMTYFLQDTFLAIISKMYFNNDGWCIKPSQILCFYHVYSNTGISFNPLMYIKNINIWYSFIGSFSFHNNLNCMSHLNKSMVSISRCMAWFFFLLFQNLAYHSVRRPHTSSLNTY